MKNMIKKIIINYSKCNTNNIHNAFNNFNIDIHIANILDDNSIEIIKTKEQIINEIIFELHIKTLKFPTMKSYISQLKFEFDNDIEDIALQNCSTYTIRYF